MDVTLTSGEVITQIQNLHSEGNSLRKKEIKQNYPELMRSALHYYPSWQDAIARSNIS